MTTPANYSNRELEAMFKGIHDRFDTFEESNKEQLTRIETQTTKTNGRVSKLEGWKNYITGGLALITILLVPILISLASDWLPSKNCCQAITQSK